MNKQHIVGIIIFTLIVGTAVVVGSFFIGIPDTKSVIVSEKNSYEYKSERKCRRKKRKKSNKRKQIKDAKVKIKQAVFNAKTERLSLEMSVQGLENSKQTAKVVLYFYVNDKNGSRQLATEFIEVNDGTSIKKMRSFNWLNNLQSHENLYIIPKLVRDFDDLKYEKPLLFNNLKATPILLRGIDNL